MNLGWETVVRCAVRVSDRFRLGYVKHRTWNALLFTTVTDRSKGQVREVSLWTTIHGKAGGLLTREGEEEDDDEEEENRNE